MKMHRFQLLETLRVGGHWTPAGSLVWLSEVVADEHLAAGRIRPAPVPALCIRLPAVEIKQAESLAR